MYSPVLISRPDKLTGAADFSSVFKLRHRLQLILGRIVNGVIGIPISVGLPILCRRRRGAGSPGRSVRGSARVAVDVRRRTVRCGHRGACRGRPRRSRVADIAPTIARLQAGRRYDFAWPRSCTQRPRRHNGAPRRVGRDAGSAAPRGDRGCLGAEPALIQGGGGGGYGADFGNR
jgi:hypothetical protein